MRVIDEIQVDELALVNGPGATELLAAACKLLNGDESPRAVFTATHPDIPDVMKVKMEITKMNCFDDNTLWLLGYTVTSRQPVSVMYFLSAMPASSNDRGFIRDWKMQ